MRFAAFILAIAASALPTALAKRSDLTGLAVGAGSFGSALSVGDSKAGTGMTGNVTLNLLGSNTLTVTTDYNPQSNPAALAMDPWDCEDVVSDMLTCTEVWPGETLTGFTCVMEYDDYVDFDCTTDSTDSWTCDLDPFPTTTVYINPPMTPTTGGNTGGNGGGTNPGTGTTTTTTPAKVTPSNIANSAKPALSSPWAPAVIAAAAAVVLAQF
ncbi:hypothetical protein DFJ73DRAFT_231421 [Zopfochytrium polystomum]|nr:hypothetical protein DFJ73DRAFT_231421 [Zopfochytrium polystomum]